MVRYSFPVRLFHSRLHAGLSRRTDVHQFGLSVALLVRPGAGLDPAIRDALVAQSQGNAGKAPSVKVTITSIDGRKLWNGENRYKKGTTAWESATDIHCGLANGIADKIVKAMQGKK